MTLLRRNWPRAAATLAVLLIAALGSAAPIVSEIQREVDVLVGQGRFIDASQLIRQSLHLAHEPGMERQTLQLEIERLDRIKKDFPLAERELFARLQASIRELRWDEFQTWVRDGWFDRQIIEGEIHYMISSVSNLFFRHPELNSRRISKKNSAAYERRLLQTVRAIRASAQYEERPYVLPKTFRVEMTLKLKPGAAPTGSVVRAWMPVPRKLPFQDNFKMVSSSANVMDLAPEDSPIRSVLLETESSRATKFDVHYEYRAHAVRFDPACANCQTGFTNVAARPYTNAGPHISFSPEVRTLSARLVQNETNPWVVAKRFYDWISANILYSYATEYSTVRNLAAYCLEKGYGDCGQEALLFISLCRLNGIPARWQSGWSIFPHAQTIHDWAEIYIEPCGWMPVDPYMGVFAMQYATKLSLWERMEVRDFYFGGLDQYRLIANSDHSQELFTAKSTPRSDTVDFQRGELESGGQNIYFDQFDYDLSVREIKPGTFTP